MQLKKTQKMLRYTSASPKKFTYTAQNSIKKLLEKDKKTRQVIKNFEKKKIILKSISNNLHLTNLIRFNALNSVSKMQKKSSKVLISNRCINTINKKKFNKLTKFSRIVFLKLVRNKKIYGLKKTNN